MTPEQAQRIAGFMRRKAAGLSPNCIEFAGELREAADIIEAAAAPPQPAAVEPRVLQIACDLCRFYDTERGSNSDLQICKRYPQHVVRRRDDVCGEFLPKEATK